MATATSWGTPFVQKWQGLRAIPREYLTTIDMSQQRDEPVCGLSMPKIRTMRLEEFIECVRPKTDVVPYTLSKSVVTYSYMTGSKNILVKAYKAITHNTIQKDHYLIVPKFDIDFIFADYNITPNIDIQYAFQPIPHSIDYFVAGMIGDTYYGYCYGKLLHKSKFGTVKDLFKGTDLFW